MEIFFFLVIPFVLAALVNGILSAFWPKPKEEDAKERSSSRNRGNPRHESQADAVAREEARRQEREDLMGTVQQSADAVSAQP